MKISIDVDVTPQELRTFLGLPDVQPLQEEMMENIREKMRAGAEGFDPVSLMKPFLPQNMQAMEALQKAFWKAFTGSVATSRKDSEENTDAKKQ